MRTVLIGSSWTLTINPFLRRLAQNLVEGGAARQARPPCPGGGLQVLVSETRYTLPGMGKIILTLLIAGAALFLIGHMLNDVTGIFY